MTDAKSVFHNTTDNAPARSSVDEFLDSMKAGPATGGQGRLIFALDATASRQPTWDMACKLQADMFREVAAIGGLSVQLAYYRGESECRTSRWVSNPAQLSRLMERLDCRAGITQIGKILTHAKRKTVILPVSALVFVGDAIEENIDSLVIEARELGRLKVPAFMFQESHTSSTEQAFRSIAEATGGAYSRFDAGAAKQLSALLKAVALFAVGGKAALEGRKDEASLRLIGQLK
jgi:hypothetical protein